MRIPFLLAAIVASVHATAQPTAEAMTAEVTDNVATEYADCAAYFSIVQGAFQSSGKENEAKKYKDASDKAAEFSLLAAKQSRTEDIATRVTLARFEMSLKGMQKTIANNYSNISLLMNKHSDSCVEAMTDSSALIKRWTEKVTTKYSKGSSAPR
ncbi:hypothetical protein [Hydrogenophaga sp.]|uniref:hypothetical protein n=1 Tax=Hydrogenophaga sp. TaxID=1904254 RepID=UPI0026055E62|nr:hypothetical protein [Hydrogenophaga sp.]MDM7950365.1 hypothetical protein [Hydrogenophaga sp.]